ncbi:allantoicase [Streptomyces sp. NPDC005438]|uniref:allantoicase n=1 Tax=Streptomyces sp. NPDC005438 TaxID=3156880 RepID=UPI0033B7E46C
MTTQHTGDALPRFTGDAAPYTGGDPFADYRSAPLPFASLVDLADRRLGGSVLAANDEFFAERENLLLPEQPRFDPGTFGHKGKVMDGWETRRRRGRDADHPHPEPDDHDWALIRLGLPGVIHGVVVDTAHFRGNAPRSVALEATALPGTPGPERLTDPEVRWTALVPRTEVGGHAANAFAVRVAQRFTHLRLRQFPDGGIARVRVHGEPVPDPDWLAALGSCDVLALEAGGRVEDASDRFYSPAWHTLAPGRSRRMNEGWETRRRRDDGHDWIRYALGERARVRAMELDTAYLKGNAAGWAEVYALDTSAHPEADPADHQDDAWRRVWDRTALLPDSNHRLLLPEEVTATHLRVHIFPDGGLARVRAHGTFTEDGLERLYQRSRLLSSGER